MIRVFVLFIALTLLIALGITGFQRLKSEEKWRLTKVVGFSIMCSLIATVIMIGMVILF